ncbi:MAG: methyltransferase domain-containing protein [Rhizobiales bacterium]|nr:methyltransferase domain-containing protein [Hyphomicrobiales bacterium]
MQVDVSELIAFYQEPLGRTVSRLIGARVRTRWRSVAGERVVGYGFATPYLGMFREEAHTLAAVMPAEQGAVIWPPEPPHATLLSAHHQLPIADSSIDRILVVHGLEMTEAPHELLREFWRVLAPEGSILLVVPNRAGLWASFDSTPFGHGRPYSRGQLERLLRAALLEPVSWSSALAFPPLRWSLVRGSAPTWERLGQRFWPAFTGVVLAEAQKQTIAPVRGTPATALARGARLRPFGARQTAGARGALDPRARCGKALSSAR